MNPQEINTKISFEEAIQKLESVIDSLNNPAEPLQKLLDLYEEGVNYLNICKQRLSEAEAKVSILDQKLQEQNQTEP
ncbi:MAG TPA: exodeoxyribonuclease VII small subunit [Candidatus Cloacimonetes bacterium]|jgi:exodeoxyribonuclease VII small subunit|nr:exodeoxyribonuclease VII small subunit [Candidatus Cloacimonas sp.]HHZ14947.1 exodeoxyribonuclease VII small subunit [Candidatus Cloacimonadota bacterium]